MRRGLQVTSWLRIGLGVALALTLAAPAIAQDGVPEANGRLTLSAPDRPAEFESFRELGEVLRKSVGITYESKDVRSIEVLLLSVLVSPDGDVLSQCMSEATSVAPGQMIVMPSACENQRYGGILDGPGIRKLESSRVELGEVMVINHEEQYGTDMRPLTPLVKLASEAARKLKVPILAIGVTAADAEASSVVRSSFRGWPCKW